MAEVNEQDMARGESERQPTREEIAEQLAEGLEILARGKMANERWPDAKVDFDLGRSDYFAEVVLQHADALRRTPWNAIETSDDHFNALRKEEILRGGERRYSGIREVPGKRIEVRTIPQLATRRQLLQAATLAVEAADLLSSITNDNLAWSGEGIGSRFHALSGAVEDLLIEIGLILERGPDGDGFYHVGEETGEVWLPEDEPALAVVGGGPET